MKEQRDNQGYLTRSLIFREINGKVEKHKLVIINLQDIIYSEKNVFISNRLRIKFKKFLIIPYTEEMPFITYLDGTTIIEETALGIYELRNE